MRIFFTALIFLLPLSAFASFEGKFTGAGTSLMHKSGTKRDCSAILLNLQQSATEFKLKEGFYDCGDLKASFDPFTLQIRDGRIFSDGQEVGTINENILDLFFANEEEGFTYHWRLEKNGDEISYLEEWTDGGKPALTVKGMLKASR